MELGQTTVCIQQNFVVRSESRDLSWVVLQNAWDVTGAPSGTLEGALTTGHWTGDVIKRYSSRLIFWRVLVFCIQIDILIDFEFVRRTCDKFKIWNKLGRVLSSPSSAAQWYGPSLLRACTQLPPCLDYPHHETSNPHAEQNGD